MSRTHRTVPELIEDNPAIRKEVFTHTEFKISDGRSNLVVSRGNGVEYIKLGNERFDLDEETKQAIRLAVSDYAITEKEGGTPKDSSPSKADDSEKEEDGARVAPKTQRESKRQLSHFIDKIAQGLKPGRKLTPGNMHQLLGGSLSGYNRKAVANAMRRMGNTEGYAITVEKEGGPGVSAIYKVVQGD